MSDSPFADRFAAKIQSGKDQPVAPEQKPTGLSSYDLSPPPPKASGDQQRPGNMGVAMPPSDLPAPTTPRRVEPAAQPSGKPLGNVFSTPELTAPAIRRPSSNNDSDVKRPQENNSEITPMAALDYVGTTLAGAGATKTGHSRVAKYVNDAQGRLSEHAVNPQLSAEFTVNQMRLKNTITERLAEAEGSYAKLITENPGLLDRGPRFLYNSEGIAEATLEQLHRPLRINSMLENIDKIPVEKISAQQAEASQQLLGQFAQDPLAAREGLTDKALTASEKAGALLEAHTNLTANVGNEAAVAKAEQEFASSIRALRLSAGTNLVTASEIASTIGEKHPELVEEVERFKVDPRINPEQAAGIERYRNLNELNTTVRNVIVPAHESANTITHQGEHIGALRGLAEHPGIKAEGLVSEAQLLESSASKVSQARLTFNTAIEREMKAFPWTGAKVLVGALAADAAVDKMLFNDSPRGNKTILADFGSASVLATRINPWAKLGVMVGAHLVGRYFDYENAPKKKH